MATTELFSGATYLVVVHSCVAYAYFHLFNMSETSQRIRMLYEIYMAGALTPEQIFSVFKPTEIIDVRLKRLIDLNQIALKNHSYIVKGKILYYAALLIMRWRDLLGFEPIETKNSC